MTQQQFQSFRAGESTLEELQAAISGIASAFEGSPGDRIRTVLDRLEGELEHIRFMSNSEDQFNDALDRIKRVEEIIGTIQTSQQ